MPANPNWSFSTLGCPAAALEEVCALASAWGMTALELRCLQDRLDLPALFTEVYGTPARLARLLSSHQLRLHVLGTSFELIGADDRTRAELLRFLPWAEALAVPWLRVFDGGIPGQLLTAEQEGQAVESVRWWQDLRRRFGWRADILMETHTACVTGSACRAIERELVEPLAVLWDTHHTWRAGEPVAQTWQALAPYVRHMHVKDSVTTTSNAGGYHYVLPGRGDFPWRELQNICLRDRYSGIFSLEWEKKWHPELAGLGEALTAASSAGWFGNASLPSH
jgi:sugar phosphate isomerase/epimerase